MIYNKLTKNILFFVMPLSSFKILIENNNTLAGEEEQD